MGCLREHGVADLSELPEGDWFCGGECARISGQLQALLERGPQVWVGAYLFCFEQSYVVIIAFVMYGVFCVMLRGLRMHPMRPAFLSSYGSNFAKIPTRW